MAPPPAASMCGSACLAHSHAALRSTAKNASQSASVIAAASWFALTPALATSTVGRPGRSAQAADALGEGPVWLPEEEALLRVDSAAGEIVRRGRDGREERRRLRPPVGFALPRAAGGLVAGVGRELVVLDPAARTLAAVEPDRPGNR